MKECIEEWWRIGRRNYNHKWGVPKSLQASPLDSQEIPMFFKLFKPLKSALEVCQIEFSSLPWKYPTFPFYMLRKGSKRAAASCARQSLAGWRATGEITETARRWLASWLCEDALARQWLASWPASGLKCKLHPETLFWPFFLNLHLQPPNLHIQMSQR